MNQEVIDQIIEKNPQIKGSRGQLEAMQPGAYCFNRSWGFGQIASYDEVTEKLIIDFETKPGHPMDPVFCLDKLDVLEATNILVRQKTEPEAIEEMIKKKPAELIVEILKHCPDQAASTAEIENLLRTLLGDGSFKSWWTKAKKALVKDPRVATPSRKQDPYLLREEPLSAEQEILEEFYFIKKPKKKIQLAEKLDDLSENVEEIKQDLPQILEEITMSIKEASHQLNQADRLYGMWVRNNLARRLESEKLVEENGGEEPENMNELIEEKIDQLEPTSKNLIRETVNLSELADDLPVRYYKRFLDLITRVYPDEWQEITVQTLLKNSSGKFTQECIGFLVDRKETERVAEAFQRWLAEQSMRGPVLLWIAKNRHSRKFKKLVQDLINSRLFAAIFYAIDNEALQSTSNRRIPLADILSDDQELVSDLLTDANSETARDLAQTLLINQGFEELTKKSLLARFIKQYPKIQSLVDSEAQSESEQLIVSQASFDARKAEYENLVNTLIPENKEAIAVAREHGDLKENSEYKMARQEQDTLMARRAMLEVEIERARITDFSEATLEQVGIGSIVQIQGAGGKSQIYSILGAWDSDTDADIISYKTPLAQSLLGKKVGEEVTVEVGTTSENWTVKGLERWVDKN